MSTYLVKGEVYRKTSKMGIKIHKVRVDRDTRFDAILYWYEDCARHNLAPIAAPTVVEFL